MRLGLGLYLGGARSAGGIAPAVPINITAPAITGATTNGTVQTFNRGTWSGTPTSFTFQLFIDGVASGSPIVIAAANPDPTRTYSTATDEGRALTIGVVATNADGSSIEVVSPARIGLYNPVIYSTNFQAASGPLVNEPGWSNNGGFNADKLFVGSLLTISDALGTGSAAQRSCDSNLAEIRVKPARNAGDDVNNAGRYYYLAQTNPQNYIGFLVTGNGCSFHERVTNNYKDIGGESGLVNDEGTEWRTPQNFVAGVRYIRVLRKAAGATEFVETPGSAAANAGKGYGPFDAALNSATQVGIGGSVSWSAARPRHTLEYAVSVPQANSISITVGTQVRSPADPNKMRVTITGTYTGSVNDIQFYVTLADGTTVLSWFAGSAITGGAISQTIDVPLTDGQAYTVWARDPDLPSSATSANATALILPQIGDAVLGMNEGFITQWSTADPYQDIGSRIEYRTPAGYYIQPRGYPVSGTQVAMSADGEGGTVKADLDGRIYGYNTAGLTHYDILFPYYFSETGIYTMPLPAGMTVTEGYSSMAWSYNSTTGELSFTVPSLAAQAMSLRFLCSSIPPGGMLAKIYKDGVAIDPYSLRAVPAASIAQIADIVRDMTAAAVNNWRNSEGGRTDTALPVDTPANTWTGFIGYSGANPGYMRAYGENGQGMWWNTKHTAGDALITQQAQLLAGTSTGAITLSELSNEVWNQGFDAQYHEMMIEGVRRGYGPDAVMTHAAAVPEVVIDGRPYVDRNTRLVSGRSFTSGDKIYIDWNGVGCLICTATTTISPGATIAIGTNVSTRYTTSQTTRASKRYLGRRSKEMWALQDAAFSAAGKPRPIHVIAWRAAAGFADFIDILDFDNTYLVTDRVSGGFYWGSAFGGIDYGPYANTVGGWSEASRDKFYGGNTAGFIADACAAFPAAINATVAAATIFAQDLAAYSLAKRGDKNAMRLNFYEISHHIQFSGWPDMAGAWAAATNYSAKQFAYSNPAAGGDGKTYRCKMVDRGDWATATSYAVADTFIYNGTRYYVTTAHTSTTSPPNANVTTTNPTASVALSNTTYWGVFVDGNGATWDAAKTAGHRDSAPRSYQAAWNALSRSQTFADDCQGVFFSRIANETGCKEIMFFDRIIRINNTANSSTNQMSAISGWGMQYTEADTDAGNYQFQMLKALKASL